MSNRKDIATGRIIYTCRCGFIDTGHVNPGGATKLWKDICEERHTADSRLNNHHTIEGKPCFLIAYWQGMGTRHAQVLHAQQFLIRKGLSAPRKKAVALRIFMEVSLGFESMQESWPYSWITDSGFSAEDLTSNLIGFYRAVEKYSWDEVRDACQPTSTEAAYQVYDENFASGIEARKVREFFKPLTFPCKECPDASTFPDKLSQIKPADHGSGDFIRIVSSELPMRHWLGGKALDFDRNGTPRG